jgi:hypothetical protein
MTNFVFAYRGGSGMATTPEAQEKTMAAWGAWFGTIGADLVEGGSPFGAAGTVQGLPTPGRRRDGRGLRDAAHVGAEL